MAKKAPKKSKAKKAKLGPAVNWLTQVEVGYTRGPKNEEVKDRVSVVVSANDHDSARKAAEAVVRKGREQFENLKLHFSTRPLTEKENEMFAEAKHVPVF